MADPTSSYLYELASLDKAIKYHRSETTKLQAQKKATKKHLLDTMKSMNIPKAGTYTLEKLDKEVNKKPVQRKKTAEKRQDAIRLLREEGVPRPKEFYNKFLATQKSTRV